MKVSVERTLLSDLLQGVQGIVERKSTMPVLSNVLIKAEDGRIEVLATDLEVAIKDSTEASVVEEGGMAVEARRIYEIVRSLPDREVSISTEDGRLKIEGGRSLFSLVGLPEEEFPTLPSIQIQEEDLLPIDTGFMMDMLEKTTFAASTDESRYNLRGVFLERDVEEGKIRMVATDGHRLSLVSKDDPGIVFERGIIIPKKGVDELKKLLPKGESLRFGIDEGTATFIVDGTLLTTRLVDGEFPDYRQVIPKSDGDRVVLDREMFFSTLKRVSILTGGSGGVRLHIDRDSMIVTASMPDLGEAREELGVEYRGEAREIIFNPRYLIEPLGVLGCDKVVLGIRDPLSPAIIRPVDDEGYLYIVMPMRE